MSNFDEAMETLKNEVEKQKAALKQQRDEINLKAHLAKADLKDELDKLEVKYEQFQKKLKPFEDEVANTNHEILNAVKDLGHELGEGYKRIISTLK